MSDDTAPMLVVTVTSLRKPGPPALRFVCRLCKQYCQPMKRDTAVQHLFKFHGFGPLAAERAVDGAESDHQTLLADRQTSKRLIDVLEAY